MSFKNIRSGDRVFYREREGLGDLKLKSGKANGLLLFADHVVVNIGGKYGVPKVVDALNYDHHKSPAPRVDRVAFVVEAPPCDVCGGFCDPVCKEVVSDDELDPDHPMNSKNA